MIGDKRSFACFDTNSMVNLSKEFFASFLYQLYLVEGRHSFLFLPSFKLNLKKYKLAIHYFVYLPNIYALLFF